MKELSFPHVSFGLKAGMAYSGYGAPPPGGYGGVSEWRIQYCLEIKLPNFRKVSSDDIGRHF